MVNHSENGSGLFLSIVTHEVNAVAEGRRRRRASKANTEVNFLALNREYVPLRSTLGEFRIIFDEKEKKRKEI